MKPKYPVWLLFWGGLFLYFAIHSCITGRVRTSKGGPYITPETNRLGFWASVIGSALVGLAFIVPSLISFFRARRREESLHSLREQAGNSSGMLFDPAETIYEAPDNSVVQVCKDYVLYGAEGKAGAKEDDKIFFNDLERIKVTRTKKSGKVRSIDLKAKGTFQAFEIAGFAQKKMEEIASLLETRIKGLPIQLVEKQSDLHLENYLAYAIVSACAIVLLIIGIAAYRVFFGR